MPEGARFFVVVAPKGQERSERKPKGYLALWGPYLALWGPYLALWGPKGPLFGFAE